MLHSVSHQHSCFSLDIIPIILTAYDDTNNTSVRGFEDITIV
jgi:hypothetical protein